MKEGYTNSDATKWYGIFVGTDEYLLRTDPDDPVTKVFADIYNNAIKG